LVGKRKHANNDDTIKRDGKSDLHFNSIQFKKKTNRQASKQLAQKGR
jgi:hypothetical protein